MPAFRHLPLISTAAMFLTFSPFVDAVQLTGYLPSYRINQPDSDYVKNVLPAQLQLLDEVRYFGMTVAADGTLTSSAEHLANLSALRTTIDALPGTHKPRVVLTLGGDGLSANFGAVAADQNRRESMATNVESFLSQYQLDGVDFDWEHPATAAQRVDYESLLKQVKQTVGARRVTATVAPYIVLSNNLFTGNNAIDGVDLMTYDIGWWGNDSSNPTRGQHSPNEYVVESVNAWANPAGTPIDRTYAFGESLSPGIAADKLGIGLPFYGRGYNGSNPDTAIGYQDLLDQGTTSDGNHYDVGSNDFWIPSLADVRQRIQFADQLNLRNVIIWDLGHDLAPSDSRSMLRAATAVPEPATSALLGLLIVPMLFRRRLVDTISRRKRLCSCQGMDRRVCGA
jgi:Glycosyl hydrolases family 18